MRKTFLLLALLTAVNGLAIAIGGAADGGGGDYLAPDDGAAWFLGNRNIRYCYEAAKGFGVSHDVLEDNIDRAFNAWQGYIEQKGVNSYSTGVLPPGSDVWAHHQLMPRCDGTEDLKFYFGVDGGEVAAVKALYSNPVAFAHRKSYDSAAGWGKGFIWVAMPGAVSPAGGLAPHETPDWTMPNALFGMILHELGHVLGCGHVEYTIMQRGIANWLSRSQERINANMSEIDGSIEMMICEAYCARSYIGGIGDPKAGTGATLFKRLTGREAVGQISARVDYRSEGPQNYRLVLTDEWDTMAFNFSIPFASQSDFGMNRTLFLRYRKTDKGPLQAWIYARGQIGFATLHPKVGADLLISVERNLARAGQFRIRYFEGATPMVLFHQ